MLEETPVAKGGLGRTIQLYMDLTSTCDIHCVHCFRKVFTPRPARLGPTQIEILERSVFPYVSRLALSETGESLYVKQLSAALAAAGRADVPFIHIQSNATHLNPEVGEMLLDSCLNVLGISLDAATRDTFEEIRVGADWSTVTANIRRFTHCRDRSGSTVWIAFNYALMRQNMNEAVDFIELAAELGADSVSFTHLFVEADEMKPWSLIYQPDTFNRLREKLLSQSKRLGIPISAPPTLPDQIALFPGPLLVSPEFRGRCRAAEEDWLFLRSNGDCFPCFNLQDTAPLGNLFERRFEEIWAGALNREFRDTAVLEHRVRGCDQCKAFTGCDHHGREAMYLAKRLTTHGVVEKEQAERSGYRRQPNRVIPDRMVLG